MQVPNTRFSLLFCFMSLCSIFTLSAQTVYNVPTASYPTIQSAITAASNGDIIAIAAVTMTETGILVNKSLTLRGAGQGSTIIQGSALAKTASTRVFQVSSGVNVRFEKMTIRHGYARSGGSSSFFSGGGAIDFNQCNFTIEDVTFKDNNCLTTASLSGGALTIKGNTSGGAACVINRCRFEGNRVGEAPSNISPDGGAIHVSGDAGSPDLIIDSCVFVGNRSGDRGGAIYVDSKHVKTIISNSAFEQNQADDDAGAVHLDHFSLTSCTFEGNSCVDEGGAIRTNSTGDETITNCTFYNNQASDGGAIRIFINTPGSMTLTNNTVYNNSGGGILIENGSGPVNLINNLLSNNNIGPADIDIQNDGTIGTNNNNLVEGCSGTCPTFAVPGPLTWPGTFTNHGGFTKTLSTLSGSNAINAGTNTDAPTVDQRDYPRTVGDYDIGAYEFGGRPVQVHLLAVCQLVDLVLEGPSGIGILDPMDMDGGTAGGTPPYSFAASKTYFTCADNGGNLVFLTVTDAVGATASCRGLLRAYDPTPPTPKCQPITVQLDATGQKTIPGNALDNGSSDVCTSLAPSNFSVSPSSFTCSDIGTLTATMTVTDASRKSSSCSAIITVQDASGLQALASQGCGSCGQIRSNICQFDPAPDLDAYVMANANYQAGATLNWFTDGGAPLPGAPTVDPTVIGTQWYRVAQQVGSGCSGPKIRVRVRVKKEFAPEFNLPAIGCGGSAQLDLAAWVSDPQNKTTLYTFYHVDPDANPGATPIGSATATLGVVNFGQSVLVPVGSSSQTYWVRNTVPNGCGSTVSSTLVAPASTASLNFIPDLTVTSGTPVNISFSGVNATYFVWFDIVSFGNPSIGIVGNAGLNSLVFTASNPTLGPLTAKIRVVSYNGNCAGQFQDFLITVNPGGPVRQGKANSLQLVASRLNARNVMLNWDITSEFELIRFEIEKEKPDGQFEAISEVKWQGNGQYDFIDSSSNTSPVVYRLKLVFADGRIVWSEAVEVNMDLVTQLPFDIFPNPSIDQFHVKALFPIESELNWQLSDRMGKVIQSGIIASQLTTIKTDHLPSAVYHLMVILPGGKRYFMKVVKQ